MLLCKDSFLPSNTATGNRSQLSHISIESLSQMYNQNLRMKFGSAPAQLLNKGEEAERSIERRVSAIKRQFDLNNLVSTKSQLSQHISKQAMQGTISSNSWNKWDSKSKSQDASLTRAQTNETKNSDNRRNKNAENKYHDNSNDSSDDENHNHLKKDKQIIGKNRRPASQLSGRSSNLCSPSSVD